jgi:glycosyltransferase involved in cell wall biosynthesis
LYTGLDESEFTPKVSIANKHKTTFKIVFRGKNNDEAGLEILARATEILADEDISFEVISNVGESDMKFSARTHVVGDFFKSKNLIASLLKDADLSLGQLSGHKRLRRTIPHKAFESAFLGVPYLTARSSGILEIFQENVEIFCFDPGSEEDLAAKIRFLKSNRKLLAESGTKMKEKYSKKLSQEILAQELMEIIRGK